MSQKLDINGNLLWVKQIETPAFAYAQSVASDPMGNVYVAGIFDGTLDLDPSSSVFNVMAKGAYDIFIQKLDANGNFVWGKQIGGNSFDHIETIVTDNKGNIYATGGFYETVDFDPNTGSTNLTSAGAYDAFVQKLDANGNLIWAKKMGGTMNDYGEYINIDTAGNIYTVGYYEGTADFDSNGGGVDLFAKGGKDIFIQKLRPGCIADLTTTASMLTITANNSNATYQWLDCDDNYSIIQGATNSQYTATQSGNYAVELTENGCVDTSACVFVSTININQLSDEISMTICPNPTKETVYLEFGKTIEQVELTVIDILGKVVLNQFYPLIKATTVELGATKGLYFLTIKTATGQQTIPIIKE